MPEPGGRRFNRPQRYTFQGGGPEAAQTQSIFGKRLEANFDEGPTQVEQFDNVQVQLDQVDFALQQDRPFSAHELQQLEHVLLDAKHQIEKMQRDPMVTNEYVDSIRPRYNMLYELLQEHYQGNKSDNI